MRKLFALTKRNLKEMLRDPLSIIFSLIFPVVMLVLMQLIFINFDAVPDNFKIESYASGICVFGFAFIGMFVAMQIASDKNSSFIKRLNIAPISKFSYYLSFVCSALPLAILQTILFFAIALIFGYPLNARLFISILYFAWYFDWCNQSKWETNWTNFFNICIFSWYSGWSVYAYKSIVWRV